MVDGALYTSIPSVATAVILLHTACGFVPLCCVAVFTTDTNMLEGVNYPPFIETEDVVGC